MKFSEEYKSAMNEISPDEQTARRIENAVLERISVPEKTAPAKKKKPFYVYAGAFSGAAACIAVLCVVLINVNSGGFTNNAGGMPLVSSSSISLKAEESMVDMADSAPTNTTNEIADIAFSAPAENKGGDLNGYDSLAGNEGLEAPAFPEAEDSENRASEPKDNAVSAEEYAITFLQDGTVVLEGSGINAEYRPDGAVTHFTKPQQDLSKAKTKDGEIYRVRLESNYLYIFEDDLQTAECYKLV